MKTVVFVGSSRNDMRSFPEPARREMGRQILRIQHGLDPTDWKPMSTVGEGVREVRIHVAGEYRAFYVTNVGNAVYILHAFRKKAKKTVAADLALGKRRFRMIGD